MAKVIQKDCSVAVAHLGLLNPGDTFRLEGKDYMALQTKYTNDNDMATVNMETGHFNRMGLSTMVEPTKAVIETKLLK